MRGRAHASNEFLRGEDGRSSDATGVGRITHLGPPIMPSGRSARPTEEQLRQLARPYTEGFERPHREADGEASLERLVGYAALVKQHRGRRGAFAKELASPPLQQAVLRAFERYRVLAVHRRGPLGVAGLERALADQVRTFIHGDDGSAGRYWIGRPILITENAYDVKLLNGDVGLVLPTREGIAAVFLSDRDEGVREVALSRLPAHEGALVLTVHKSQGSQFDRVALVLAGRPSPIQTRELVYTGVTRAKEQLVWLGEESELAEALDRRVARTSGLASLLRRGDPGFIDGRLRA
jgi:exodeoxyribonuclease V alpha subunit